MFQSLFLLGLSLLCIQAAPDALTVHTQQGNVAGTLVIPTVRQFLGIPFATANRWEAPRLPQVRNTTFVANAFGDSCVQLLDAGNTEFLKLVFADQPVPESENCLSVNIWAPSVNRKQKTAVLIWIYGGSFQFGTSNTGMYNGENLVRDHDDILLVSINYRTNIFGQPNAPQLLSTTQSQNFGLLDRDAAIQWVHDNIAAFGGDPERITIFGQSAGSVSVDSYTFSHPNDKIVKGVIEQSGTVVAIVPASTNQTFDPTPWNQVSNAVGCGTAVTPAQFKCMQGVPFRTLENAVISTGISFGFVADNITVFSDTVARAAAGKFLHVPLLGGSTAQEMDIFLVGVELLAIGVTLPVVTEILSDALTQLTFTCPAGASALARLQAGVPTWRYQYQAVFPGISTRPDLRAFHASEIPLVFGNYNLSIPLTNIPSTPTEVALSKYIQSAWVAFARNPQSGLSSTPDFGWPMYNPLTQSLVQLGGFANPVGASFASGGLLDLTCQGAAEALLAQITQVGTQLEEVAGQALAALGVKTSPPMST